MTTSSTASVHRNRSGARRSGIVLVVFVASIGCASQTEQDLKNALRGYVGDSTTTSESVMSAPPPPPTTTRRETTTTSATVTTRSVPRIGDGLTISRRTADQADRCLAGWYTMRDGVESSGRLERDEFERVSTECDEAVHLLSLDRSHEVLTTGPTEQLNALLLQLRLQWMTPRSEFATQCPSGPSTRCSLGAQDLGGSFDFLVISGPSAIIPGTFLDEVDQPLDVSQIPGLEVDRQAS